MNTARIINILITIALVEMMISIGLDVTFSQVLAVARKWRAVLACAVANYVCVPAAAVGLLLLFHAKPMVAAGFLVVAVCPGAPYGPPLTGIARGNVPSAVGLMVILAASSAILAPLLLGFLLPLMAGNEPLTIDAIKLVTTLLVTQLLPLLAGLVLRHKRPDVAQRLSKPARKLSAILNLTVFGLILAVQFRMLLDIRLRGFVGMAALLALSALAGWLLSERGTENRRAMALMTSVRNVGVGLVIIAGSFPGTPAVTAGLAYGLFQIIVMMLVAIVWGRSTSGTGDLPAAA
jgi:bile acid:Na+ symporter, BASS family